MNIKTWMEFYRAGGVSIEQAMELESAELRAALQECDAEIERLRDLEDLAVRRANTATEKLTAQRKVLETALEALKWCGPHDADSLEQDAITAIQEQLK